jgi:hypothetical protein
MCVLGVQRLRAHSSPQGVRQTECTVLLNAPYLRYLFKVSGTQVILR